MFLINEIPNLLCQPMTLTLLKIHLRQNPQKKTLDNNKKNSEKRWKVIFLDVIQTKIND